MPAIPKALIERALGAELTRHLLDPWACMRDVLARLPTHLNSHIDDLLPHRWQPLQTTD